MVGMSKNHAVTLPVPSTEVAPESFRAAIEHAAASAPDAVALRMGEQALTYREVNARANRLADQLCLQGVGPEVPVGLICGRSLETIIGMLAILKADGVAVPFDATLPAERLRTMVALAGLRLIVTTEAMHSARAGMRGPVAVVRMEGDCPAAPNLQSRLRPENTSHFHFTTSATGRPRAVPISHAASENLLRWQQNILPFALGTRVLQFSPSGLDSAWQEIAGTLAAGGTLVIPTAQERASTDRLVALLSKQEIERAFLPAITLAHVVDVVSATAQALPHLRDLVAFCGPVLISSDTRAFFTAHPGCRLHAHYGHCETLVALACTVEGAPASWPAIIPLGKPVRQVSAMLLDPQGRFVRSGEVGELWIGGPHLSRGYHRDPAANRERFLPDPSAAEGSPARIFRTGERVRLNSEGDFELAGPAAFPPVARGKPRRRTESSPVLSRRPAPLNKPRAVA